MTRIIIKDQPDSFMATVRIELAPGKWQEFELPKPLADLLTELNTRNTKSRTDPQREIIDSQ